MATNQGFKSLVPYEDQVEARFLYWWIRANKDRLQNLGVGATFKEISKSVLGRVEIPLPELEEQRRIADILDKADALRAKRRQAIAHLDSLSQSIFHGMFGEMSSVSWLPLKDTVRTGDRINYGVVQPGESVENGVRLIRVGDFSGTRVNPTKLKLIDASVESKYRRSRLAGDEILVSCVGSIGDVVLAHDALKGANIARAVARIPVAAGFDRRFLAEFIRSSTAQHYLRRETRTVSQPTLNIKELSELPIPALPLELQSTFANRVIAVDHLRAKNTAQLAELDNLFLALQDRAFKGEL